MTDRRIDKKPTTSGSFLKNSPNTKHSSTQGSRTRNEKVNMVEKDIQQPIVPYEENEEDEEIRISPSGSVLVASENPYNKSERIIQANIDLANASSPPPRMGRVHFSEKIVIFNYRKETDDTDEEEIEEESQESEGMEEQFAAKLLIVSLLPPAQTSEDSPSYESETEEICFDDSSRTDFGTDASGKGANASELPDEEGGPELVEGEVVEKGEVVQETTRQAVKETTRHLSRAVSLSRDTDSEEASLDEEEVGRAEEEDDKECLFDSEPSSESSEQVTKRENGPPASPRFEEPPRKGSEDNSAGERKGQAKRGRPNCKNCKTSPFRSREAGPRKCLEAKRPNSCVADKRSPAAVKERPSTAPSKRLCSPAWKPDRLPQYNGFRSEYGLSVEQLQERKRNKVERAKRLRLRKLQKSEEVERRRNENDLMFTSWLAKKRKEANEKLIACSKLNQPCQFKISPAPTTHLQRTSALRKKELKGLSCCGIQELLRHSKPKDQKTYKIYLGLSIE